MPADPAGGARLQIGPGHPGGVDAQEAATGEEGHLPRDRHRVGLAVGERGDDLLGGGHPFEVARARSVEPPPDRAGGDVEGHLALVQPKLAALDDQPADLELEVALAAAPLALELGEIVGAVGSELQVEGGVDGVDLVEPDHPLAQVAPGDLDAQQLRRGEGRLPRRGAGDDEAAELDGEREEAVVDALDLDRPVEEVGRLGDREVGEALVDEPAPDQIVEADQKSGEEDEEPDEGPDEEAPHPARPAARGRRGRGRGQWGCRRLGGIPGLGRGLGGSGAHVEGSGPVLARPPQRSLARRLS